MLAAIDTSTETVSLALSDEGRLMAEITWHSGQNHTVQLLPRFSVLLKTVGIDISSITLIIVAIGPGSFNGLRVGISTAKGLAHSLGIPVIGVSTLEVEAYQFAACGLPVCAIHKAGGSEIAAAIYRNQRNEWRQLVSEHITTLDTLLEEINTRTLFCGEYITQIGGEISRRLKSRAIIPQNAALLRRAFFLAELGRKRLDSGLIDNPAILQPLYLRRPQITERKHH